MSEQKRVDCLGTSIVGVVIKKYQTPVPNKMTILFHTVFIKTS